MALRSPTFTTRGFRTPAQDKALRAADDWNDHAEVCLDCKRAERQGNRCGRGRALYETYMGKRSTAMEELRKWGIL
jgi:hypothetical protein